MIALPFIYFLIWFIIEFRKRGLDVYTFIILLYTMISFFSILFDGMNLYYDSCPKKPSLGVMAPLLYLSLLTLCIQPFSKFQNRKIASITNSISEKRFNYIVYSYFVIFLVILIVSLTRIQEILTSNAMAEIRGELYSDGTVSFYDHLSGIPRYICAICGILSPSSFLMILFLFIGITHFHKGVFFIIVTLCGSLSQLLVAINIVDRSNFMYWGLTFALCFTIFRHNLPSKAKRFISLLIILLATFFIFYLASVTMSRFGEGEDALDGIIRYLGMSYINFCNFFNHLVFEVPHRPEIVLFPNLNAYILHGPSYFEYAGRLSNIYHNNVSTFSTFIGLIMSVAGVWVTIIYCFAYRFITRLFLRRPQMNQINLKRLILFWIVVLNIVLGLFGYYYMSAGIVMNIAIWWVIGIFVTRPIKN